VACYGIILIVPRNVNGVILLDPTSTERAFHGKSPYPEDLHICSNTIKNADMCVLWQRVAYANSLCLAMRVHLKIVMLSNPVACESIFKSVIFIIINGLWASNKDVTGIKGYLHRT